MSVFYFDFLVKTKKTELTWLLSLELASLHASSCHSPQLLQRVPPPRHSLLAPPLQLPQAHAAAPSPSLSCSHWSTPPLSQLRAATSLFAWLLGARVALAQLHLLVAAAAAASLYRVSIGRFALFILVLVLVAAWLVPGGLCLCCLRMGGWRGLRRGGLVGFSGLSHGRMGARAQRGRYRMDSTLLFGV